ncbi:hypothetical protein PG993_009310 [Apiospora rasikravindrae]|uniref:EVE domain-containing protein n=1 Tax=Apiospora rasikravindrae TaxID=990691 RepID=A0ABR1SJ09_9PEZI
MPPKRKAPPPAEDEVAAESSTLRRSTRRKSSAPVNATKAATTKTAPTAKSKVSATEKKTAKSGSRSSVKTNGDSKEKTAKSDTQESQAEDKLDSAKPVKITQKESESETNSGAESSGPSREKSYWLLKAEPETRLENGVDVRFSIDDLASRSEPEPWDGIRNYAARNNLRAMKKGDLAFFYHSNCKEPGVVGTMEIVREHSPDRKGYLISPFYCLVLSIFVKNSALIQYANIIPVSAHDPKAPYYDASSKPSEPKWSVVHVEFRSKFAKQIGLKELREMGKPGQPLENMQLLKQSRLSVSRVSSAEFEYLMGVAAARGGMSKEV